MSAYLNRLLRKAAQAGDVDKIVRLVRRGACPASKGRDGRDTIAIIDAINDEKLSSACKAGVSIGLLFAVLQTPRDPNDNMYDDFEGEAREANPANGKSRSRSGARVRNAILERLLRKAVMAGDAEKIEALVFQGAVGDVKGRDGRDAIDLVNDIKDSETRVRCRWAMLAKDLDEYFEEYPERRRT